MAEHSRHKKHHYKHTHMEHHDDGSITIHHEHEIPSEDVKHAVGDLDAAHDSMEAHLGEPNEDEEAGAAGAVPAEQVGG